MSQFGDSHMKSGPEFIMFLVYNMTWGSDKSWDKTIDEVFKDGQDR
jgi:hypothetical protein